MVQVDWYGWIASILYIDDGIFHTVRFHLLVFQMCGGQSFEEILEHN